MWHLAILLGGELGRVGLKVGPADLKGLFQPMILSSTLIVRYAPSHLELKVHVHCNYTEPWWCALSNTISHFKILIYQG